MTKDEIIVKLEKLGIDFDIWESDDLPKNIKPFNDYYVDKEKLKNL